MDENRKKALAAALSQIEKQFGTGSVMRMGDTRAVRNLEVVSSGSLALDIALGVGGLPRGRVVEIYGPESSGKTTLALQAIAQVQKAGGTAAFVDAEHNMPRSLASRWRTCSFRSPTPVSRRWKSPTCWCAPAPSTPSSSTRWRR